MSVKLKISESLKHIELGSVQDDSVYLRFVLGKGQVGHKLIAEIKTDKKYNCTLRGENEIINWKGESIETADKYLSYMKRGRIGAGQLNFNKKAYLCVEESGESTNKAPLIFSSIADMKAYFEVQVQLNENAVK